MTAGHNALRGSGPGQKHAFEHAMARVGCPDRRIDRLCITCCSPSQPSHHAGCPARSRLRRQRDHMRRSKSHHSITPSGQMACDALTAVARCFVLSLDSEQVVTKKAVRLHCHSVPKSGSDTACGRPTATAAPTATIATTAIASVLDLCQMNLMAFSDLRGLKSALCRRDSLRASSPLRNRTTGTSLPRTSAPVAPVTMSDSALAGFSPRRLRQGRPPN
jgi:hypothetical protein